jgi:pimeloyl-ACP methyl ester carboxylesterase
MERRHLSATEYLPVAYLPGAGGRAAVWDSIADVLAFRREALVFDYPGLSDGSPPADIHCLSDLSDWIATQLPERCDLVAISMGSALAFRLALDHPSRIRRLVLVVPCGGLDPKHFGALDWRGAFLEERPHAPRWFVEDRVDFSERLSTISAPSLIVCGTNDLIAPPAMGEFLATRLPRARFELVHDASHDLEEEHPALLASLIEAHLRR